jgi:hypothetical protein
MSNIDCVYLYLSLQESKFRIFQVTEVVLLKHMKVLGSTKSADVTNSPIRQAIQKKEHASRYVHKCLYILFDAQN